MAFQTSSIFFDNGHVIKWDIWPGSLLKVRMLPSGHVTEAPGYFTLGSTKDEVLAAQGTPTETGSSIETESRLRPLKMGRLES